MKAAGCYNIILGLESSKDKFLDYLKKDFTIEQVKRAFKLIKKSRIEILAYFMYGIPGQKIEDIRHNIKFIKKLKPDYISVMILQIFSGTELIKIAQNEGWISEGYIENYKSPENYLIKRNIPYLNEEVLNYYIKKTYLEFFFNVNTLLKSTIRYIRNPSRFFNMIKNLIRGFS